MTNIVAAAAANGTMNLSFTVQGGDPTLVYDVYGTAALMPGNITNAQWYWLGQVTTCGRYSVTNLPPTAVSIVLGWPTDVDGDGLPNAFESLVSKTDPNNPDSYGDGLLDGWRYIYYGTNSVDPYSLCPSGDGWTLLQASQNGWNPNTFYAPPAPQGLTASYSPANEAVSVTWLPSPGPVTNYVLQRWIPETSDFEEFNLPPGTTNFADTFPLVDPNPFYIPPEYDLEAQYPGGDSPWSRATLFNPRSAVNAQVLRGTQGKVYVAIPAFSSNISAVRVTRDYYSQGIEIIESNDVPASSFTNGLALLPDDWMAAMGPQGWPLFQCSIQTVNANGSLSDPFDIPWVSSVPFFDGSQQLKQNLAFALRAADQAEYFCYAMGFDYGLLEYNIYATNYASAGFWDTDPPYYQVGLNEFRPFAQNHEYSTFVFVTNNVNLASFPITLNGVNNWGYASSGQVFEAMLQNPCPNAFVPPTNLVSIPAILGPNQSRWTFSSAWQEWQDYDPVAVAFSGNTVHIVPGALNYFGLPYVSEMLAYRQNSVNSYSILSSQGSASSDSMACVFPEVAAPNLQTIGYCFFRPGVDPMPNQSSFSTANTTPSQFFAGFGQTFNLAGYAKQAITNGYSNYFGYLGQYFDQAYTIDGKGVATTNSAGLLSPYGEFFPTIPGPAALVTMPDIDTGQRGTGVVNVIKLQLDVNNDTVMDTSFGGPDNTSQIHPYVFWVNNNYDRFTLDDSDLVQYDDDVSSTSPDAKSLYTGKFTPDYDYTDAAGNRIISCSRDLQDFARLWVCGITTNLLTNLPPGTTITLSWGDVGNPNPANPTIDLFKAADPDGGIGYLTNSLTAALQTLSLTSPYIGRLGPGSNLVLNAITFANAWAGNYFIWCGVSNGTGALTLTISQGGTNTLAQTTAYIQLVDIKQMYERWTIGDSPIIPAYTNAVPAVEDLPLGVTAFQYPPPTDTNTPYILYVHGWNMERWEKDRFAESAFKRLYWLGYQGRFGVFRWPTENRFKGTWTQLLTSPGQKDNFDRSEYTAWKSGAALLNKLNDLNQEYPGHIYLLAHSMGNIVAGEALRLAGANRMVNTYVASQAAVSAHTYDTNIPNYSFTYGPSGFGPWAPNIYVNWLATNAGAGAGQIINFYNTNDYALQRSVWQINQLLKPDQYVPLGGSTWSYDYGGFATDPPPWTNFHKDYSYWLGRVNFDIYNVLTNRYEVMALDAQSWTTALGATPGVLNVNRNVQLTRTSPTRIWPADSTGNNYTQHFWHSAEFRGDYWQQQGYWSELLGAEAFNLK